MAPGMYYLVDTDRTGSFSVFQVVDAPDALSLDDVEKIIAWHEGEETSRVELVFQDLRVYRRLTPIPLASFIPLHILIHPSTEGKLVFVRRFASGSNVEKYAIRDDRLKELGCSAGDYLVEQWISRSGGSLDPFETWAASQLKKRWAKLRPKSGKPSPKGGRTRFDRDLFDDEDR